MSFPESSFDALLAYAKRACLLWAGNTSWTILALVPEASHNDAVSTQAWFYIREDQKSAVALRGVREASKERKTAGKEQRFLVA